jgi:class 3 adenylate cyclase
VTTGQGGSWTPKLIKQQPLIVLLLVGFIFGAGLLNLENQRLALEDSKAWSNRDRELQVAGYLDVAKQMGKLDRWDELQAALDYAKAQNLIDFYVLQEGQDVLWFGQRDPQFQELPLDVRANEVIRTKNVVASAVQVGDFKVTIGLDKNYDPRAVQRAEANRSVWLAQMVQFAFALFLVALWSLKDILKIVSKVRAGKIKDLKSTGTLSKESDLFVRGLMGYAQTVEGLEEENHRLGRQVLPSLKKEITSGKKPPYDFYCTMVRTDINNFSTIYNTHNVTEFMATINQFFHEVSLIVARYNGLVHEFVGDEVIFYFKDDEHENSVAIALSAIRDINAMAEKFHAATTEARGYPFTVKSSLAHGKVRFGPLVNGFSIAGSVLIETVRILSHIHEKDGNVVYYDGIHQPVLAGVTEGVERQRVTLKGFQEEKVLFQYLKHQELASVLHQLDDKNVSRLSLYRSDFDLFVILKDMKSQMRNRPLSVSLRAVQILRQAFVTKTTASFGDVLVDWIGETQTWMVERPDAQAEKLLSAIEMLFVNLVPKEDFTSNHEKTLKSLLQSSDKRVVANALEVLTHFQASVEKKIVQRFEKSELRIAANALVNEGREELKPAVVRRLGKMLSQKEKNTVIASALFAIGELAKIHRERDLVYYSTQTDFTKMVESLDQYIQHTNSMVRRQAMVAARKAADSAVLERVVTAVVQADSKLLEEEAERYLSHYWSERRIVTTKAA